MVSPLAGSLTPIHCSDLSTCISGFYSSGNTKHGTRVSWRISLGAGSWELGARRAFPSPSSPAPSSQLYCGDIDQAISSPLCTPNGSLVTGEPERRTGRASKVIEVAPAVTVGGSAKVAVSPPGRNPSR
jgi:hypothetical protein